MKEILDDLFSILKSRILPIILLFAALFILLIFRIFQLQIVKGESYQVENTSSNMKKMDVPAARGRIFDRNKKLLAYNDLAYCVKISDSGTYKDNEEKNKILNDVINRTIDLIEKNGDKVSNDFLISIDENGDYQYNVEDAAKLRYFRDFFGKKSVDDLTDEQKNLSAAQFVKQACDKYEISDQYKPSNILEIINLRSYMSANSYNRYITFTIAYEVSDKTVAAVAENSSSLVGVEVDQEYVRKYNDSIYLSNILGYTGMVSTSEQEENKNLHASDTIGKAGIEQSLDSDLRGKNGSKEIYVDTVGRITQVLDETDSISGNDVYLTIDVDLQKKVYEEIENELVKILLDKIVAGDSNKRGTSSGGSEVIIPVKSVYFALINNNLISINKIAEKGSGVEADVYSAFESRISQVMPQIYAEFTDSPTVYKNLSSESKEYIEYIENSLKNNGILNKDKIDTADSVYKNWYSGAISFKEFLTYAITKNWIDMAKLTTEQYSSLQEAYDSLVNYVTDKMQQDVGFQKIVYKYLIQSGVLSGRQLCMILYEQGVLDKSDSDYASLSGGGMGSYDFIRKKIENKEITPAQLALEPCSGSAVVTDPRDGKVLALVSYPGYDNNRLSGKIDSDYYYKLYNDQSMPLYDKATSVQNAPGSIFKPVSAISGLEQGVISPGELIYCGGAFTQVTPSPRCWKLSGHGNENVSTALRDSCNVFFYNVGYRLAMENGRYNSSKGTSILQNYAEQLGLATKSNIEIFEKEPHASNVDSIASAIGQGTNLYSNINLARYVSTIASSGVNHELTLLDRVEDQNGNLIRQNTAAVSNVMNIKSSTWDAVHNGMQMVIGTQLAFRPVMSYKIAGKSGTAQENLNESDHATFITYAPYDNPTVTISSMIPHGYSSSYTGALIARIYQYYFESQK